MSTVVIKRYPNRRLYDTEKSAYITIDDLAEYVQAGREVQVTDARSGEDLTRRTLMQVLLTDDHVHKLNCMPLEFLRTLIQLQDPSMMGLFERYVGVSLNSFAVAQQAMQQNLELMQKMIPNPGELLGMMNPFAAAQKAGKGAPANAATPPPGDEGETGGES